MQQKREVKFNIIG